MAEAINEKKENQKYRIATLLGLFAIGCYNYNNADSDTFIRITAVAAVIALSIAVIIIKSRLVYFPIAKGIGGIVVGISVIFWKKMHAYSENLSMTTTLTLAIFAVILSFKYSAAELEQRVTKQNAEVGPKEK